MNIQDRLRWVVGILCLTSVGLYAAEPRRRAAARPVYTFTKLVDLADTIPGDSQPFVYLDSPSLSQGDIAFLGAGFDPLNLYRDGVYAVLGGQLQKIADEQTLLPDSQVKFGDFNSPVISGGDIVFAARSADASLQAYNGIHRWRNGVLTTLVDSSTPAPGLCGRFEYFTGIAYRDGVLVFGAHTQYPQSCVGLYRLDNGRIERLATTTTPVPGHPGESFYSFDRTPAVYGTLAAFVGVVGDGVTLTPLGVYTSNAGPLMTVADSNPDGYGPISASDQALNLIAGRRQLQQFLNDRLKTLFDVETDRAPGSPSLKLNGLDRVAATQTAAVFRGGQHYDIFINEFYSLHFTVVQGVYANYGLGWEKVVAGSDFPFAQDTVDGKRVASVGYADFAPGQPFRLGAGIDSTSADGNQIACVIRFVNGTQGIYLIERSPP